MAEFVDGVLRTNCLLARPRASIERRGGPGGKDFDPETNVSGCVRGGQYGPVGGNPIVDVGRPVQTFCIQGVTSG